MMSDKTNTINKIIRFGIFYKNVQKTIWLAYEYSQF